MSFVANLKQARATQSLATAQESQRTSQFKIAPSRQLGAARQPVGFGSAPVDGDDPMFPSIRLVSRYMSREETQNSLPSSCETLTITDLLKQVHPPDFRRAADTEPNFVVLGIVATRSESRTSQSGRKYSMLLLSDLKYDISLALHGKAYETHWKVQPGTLIAVLNPRFWVQKSVGDSRTLALSVIDNKGLLEIGQAKDLGQCEEMTSQSKHTKRCKNWVDVRKSHVCEFHVEQRTARSKRPELNSAGAKLWDPKQGASGKRMSIIRGGDVPWKRGLQVDNQAGIPRAFHDAPVGNVFQSGSQRSPSAFFDTPFDTQVRKRQREKRRLEDATGDATLSKRLLTGTPKARGSDRPAHAAKGSAVNSPAEKDSARTGPAKDKAKDSQVTAKFSLDAAIRRAALHANGDSDSDLEIVR